MIYGFGLYENNIQPQQIGLNTNAWMIKGNTCHHWKNRSIYCQT